MDELMRLVLNKLDELSIKIEQMDAKIDKMDARLNAKIDEMDARLNAKIDEMDARIDARFERIETRLSRLEITVEQDLSRKIDVIGEGHDFLARGVEEARKMESTKERMDLQIINLEMDVKKIKQHLSLA